MLGSWGWGLGKPNKGLSGRSLDNRRPRDCISVDTSRSFMDAVIESQSGIGFRVEGLGY